MLDQIAPYDGVERFIMTAGFEEARVLAHDFVAAVAGDVAEGVIDVNDRAVSSGDHDGFAGMGEDAGGELEFFFGFLYILDVGACAKPINDLAVRIVQRYSTDQPPAVNAIGAAQPTFKRVNTIGLYRVLPGIPCSLSVISMDGGYPTITVALFQRQPGEINPLLIVINVPTVRSGNPDDLWYSLGQCAEFLFALPQCFLRQLAFVDVVDTSLKSSFTIKFYGIEQHLGNKVLPVSARLCSHSKRQ